MDYNNPGSFLPQLGWKPQGFLAGHLYAQQEQDYRQRLELSNQAQQLGLLKQMAEMDTYGKDAPVREARRGFDISKYTAEAPIQGRLAAAAGARADADVIQSVPNAQHKVWENGQKQKERMLDLVGDNLSQLVDAEMPDPARMQLWRDQIVPILEQQSGQKLPDELKMLDPQMMRHMALAITNDKKHRQAVQIRQMIEDGLTQRNDDDNEAMKDREAMRDDRAGRRESQTRLTEAQRKLDEFNQLVHDLVYAKQTEVIQRKSGGAKIPNELLHPDNPEHKKFFLNEREMADIQNWARLEAINRLRAGNPEGRAQGRVMQEAGEMDVTMDLMDNVQAEPIPMKDGQLDMSRLKDGKKYVNSRGQVGIWNSATGKFEPARRQQGPIPTHQIIR